MSVRERVANNFYKTIPTEGIVDYIKPKPRHRKYYPERTMTPVQLGLFCVQEF